MHEELERQRSFGRRALIVGAGQVALFGLLGYRLHQLQVTESRTYQLLAEDNRINQRLIVPPRGQIFDRRGTPLALNIPTYRLRIVRERARRLDAVLDRLASLVAIAPDRLEAVRLQTRNRRAFEPVTIRDDLTWDEVARVAVNAPDLPGVLLENALVRAYPHGPMLAHVLGYVGPVNQAEQDADPDPLLRQPAFRIGKNGIEGSYEAELRGSSGASRVEVNALGREIRELDRREGEPGEDLQLSLDLDLQRYCLERLAQELAASAVVLDIATGAVLAMASVPSFEPAVFISGLKPAVWAALRDNPLDPLVNKCIRGQYPPGSTFKMMTGLAALETGAITHTSQAFCPGHMTLGSARFHCWRPGGHGSISLVDAIAQSCDVFFYDAARRAGVDAIAEMATRFGLGAPTGIDLPGERPGLIPTKAWKLDKIGEPWQRGETLVVGIGQGFVSTTPLQLAVMTARLANGGREVHPWFVRGRAAHVDQGRGEEPRSLGVRPENLAWILRGMNAVVNSGRGTARGAALDIPGIAMAGKTGTSQVRRITRNDRATGQHKRADRPREERDHALFVAFAPTERPRYAVAVVVEHGQSGSKAAGPIAKDIMTRALEIDPAADGLFANAPRPGGRA